MTKQHLNDADVGAGIEQVSGEAVCRNVCTVTGLLSLARRAATRQASCNVATLTGSPASRPGNTQQPGRARQ
jgi:hypothetical protein